MNPSDSADKEISSPISVYHVSIMEEIEAALDSEWNRQKIKKFAPVEKSISCMDTKVFKAAQEGNVDALRERSNDLLQMLTATKSTVLHVYIDYIAGVASAKTSTKSKELLIKSAEVVRKMLRMAPRLLLQPNQSGNTALHLAARHGRADIVEALIEEAAKGWHGDLEEGISSAEVCQQILIRRINKEKDTALHEAVRFNHLDVVEILTREDPEFLYPANDAGETPLYVAAERRYSNLVSQILDTCTSPSYQGPKGLTALHIAAIEGDEVLTRRLLEKERELAKASDEQGRTPLHFAAYWSNDSIVKQILECDKSTAYIGDKYKSTPVHYAARAGGAAVMKHLYFYSPDSFELVDDKGRNALHIAIINDEHEVEKFLREDPWLSSVLLNGKDLAGNTPLHQIAISESSVGLEFISDSRVDKMAFNKENVNALDISRQSKDHPWRRIVRYGLRKSGARLSRRLLSIKDNSGGNTELVGVKESDRDSKFKDLQESHMVVSALIATVTFAAGFTLPGGSVSKGNKVHAVLSKNAAFKAFVITNTLAMSLSSCAIMVHFLMLRFRREITELNLSLGSYGAAMDLTMCALVAMVLAFITGTYAVLGGPSSLGLAIAAFVLGCYFFFVLGATLIFLPDFPSWRRFHDFIRGRIPLIHFFAISGKRARMVALITLLKGIPHRRAPETVIPVT